MPSLLHGVPWVHVVPAVLAVVLGFLYLKTKWIYLKVIPGILWLLFLPNAAYIFTDVARIALHWSLASGVVRTALIIQYILLELIGLTTYLLAMLPLESMIRRWHLPKKTQTASIIILNFFIGFGMVLGRTEYINSYVVFTQPTKVMVAGLHIVISLNLLGLTLIFGILCNCIYFIFRRPLLRRVKMVL